MKCHIGVNAGPGLVHTVCGTTGGVNDVVQANSLLHGWETMAFGDAGYRGAHKRTDARPGVTWHMAMRAGKRNMLDPSRPIGALNERIERLKASIRARWS